MTAAAPERASWRESPGPLSFETPRVQLATGSRSTSQERTHVPLATSTPPPTSQPPALAETASRKHTTSTARGKTPQQTREHQPLAFSARGEHRVNMSRALEDLAKHRTHKHRVDFQVKCPPRKAG